ncbi:MAG: hypothetical protein HFF75_05005 [Oscillospiraceae bacterium]|nr:hypothetical protein [Oscillospiraceae bacterium]MCI8721422.1 hypothetical protein [Oscillospiraceae bacterium]MCI9214607.1 hypothetical protein [Oscillospiraceae bacterium]
MEKKVSLKELVGTKIIYAGLIAAYYWMWARQDWHNYYDAIQNAVFLFTILFFILQASRIRRYSKEEKDRQAIQTLRRTDAILLKVLAAAAVAIAFACAVTFFDGRMAGYALVGTIFALTVLRTILFCVMDAGKG